MKLAAKKKLQCALSLCLTASLFECVSVWMLTISSVASECAAIRMLNYSENSPLKTSRGKWKLASQLL